MLFLNLRVRRDHLIADSLNEVRYSILYISVNDMGVFFSFVLSHLLSYKFDLEICHIFTIFFFVTLLNIFFKYCIYKVFFLIFFIYVVLQISHKRGDLKKKLKVTFVGEPGVDMGGLTKEWFMLLIRKVFRPEYGKQ